MYKCFFCNTPCEIDSPISPPISTVFCPQCGTYSVSVDSGIDKLSEEEKTLIAGYLFETRNNLKNNVTLFDGSRIKEILNSPLMPRNLSDKISKLLSYIDKQSKFFGESIRIPAIAAYTTEIYQRDAMLKSLSEERLINLSGGGENYQTALRIEAFKYIKKQEEQIVEDSCFVARWFDPSMKNLWENIIQPGCKAAGYNPQCVTDKQFNGNIVDEIIAGIKERAFTVVDLTGYRGGVYYEAGFAAGLGKQVILMCHEDHLDGNPKKHKRVHFDVSHTNIIRWKEGREEEARIELTNRIRATIGKGPYLEGQED